VGALDIPAWGQVAENGLSVIISAVGLARQRRATEFAGDLQDEVHRTSDAIAALVDGDPRIAQLLGDAWEVAAGSASYEKRRLLARVVARALEDPPDDARIEAALYLVRTLDVLEPGDVRMLVLVAVPRDDPDWTQFHRIEGLYCTEELVQAWGLDGSLAGPTLALLRREGLIDGTPPDLMLGRDVWSVTNYGRKLLDHLTDEDSNASRLRTARLAARIENQTLVVRNLGPDRATSIRVGIPPRSDGRSILWAPDRRDALELADAQPPPFDLDAGREEEWLLYPPTVSDHPPYSLDVEWVDRSGSRRDTLTAAVGSVIP